MRKALEYLVSGCIVYLVVAACAASEGTSNYDNGMVNNSGGLANSGGVNDIVGGVSGDGSNPTDGNNAGGESDSIGGNQPAEGDSGSGGMMDQMMNPIPAAQAQSGSRLKANWIVGADGSKQWTSTWHDTMLNLDCYFAATSNGYRCVPTPVFPLGQTFTYFSNSGCSTGLIPASGCLAYEYVAQFELLNCAQTYSTVSKIGAQYTGTVYTGTPGNCTALTSTVDVSFYTVGAEIPLTSFVAGTATTDP